MREGQHLAFEFIHNTPTRTNAISKTWIHTNTYNAGLSK